MGICTSCYSRTNTTTTATVKLVLLNGQLREFASPIRVFLVSPPLNDFICNADHMDFNNHVTAMSGEEELRSGQLYFELPASWLHRRLTVEDMASLAVKAGTALMKGGGTKVRCGCWVKQRVDPLVFGDEDDEMMTCKWSRVEGSGGGGDVGYHGHGGGRQRGGGGKGRMFTKLERIVEE